MTYTVAALRTFPYLLFFSIGLLQMLRCGCSGEVESLLRRRSTSYCERLDKKVPSNKNGFVQFYRIAYTAEGEPERK